MAVLMLVTSRATISSSRKMAEVAAAASTRRIFLLCCARSLISYHQRQNVANLMVVNFNYNHFIINNTNDWQTGSQQTDDGGAADYRARATE